MKQVLKKKSILPKKSPKTIHCRNGNLSITVWGISFSDHFVHVPLFEEAKSQVSLGGNFSMSCPLITLRWLPISGHWSSSATFSHLMVIKSTKFTIISQNCRWSEPMGMPLVYSFELQHLSGHLRGLTVFPRKALQSSLLHTPKNKLQHFEETI